MAQVNCSITLNTGDDVSSGTNAEDDAVVNPSVAVGSDFQVSSRLIFPFTIKLECHITSSECMEEGQRLTFVFTKFHADRIDVVVPKVFPYTKSNPQIKSGY